MTDKECKTILLVEDEIINAKVSINILKNHGYKVIHKITGEEAVELFSNDTGIDLVLMDIDLGEGIDGTEAAKIILERREIPIIFLSLYTEPEIVKKTEEIPSYGYIVKNSGETVLIASIKIALNLFESKIKEREKEERYRSFIAVSNTGAWEYNYITGSLRCSSEYYRMLGLDPEEYNSRKTLTLKDLWTDLLHPDDRERALGVFNDYRERGTAGAYENHFRMRHRSGRWIWICSHGQTLRRKDGSLTDLTIGTHIDITELKLAEELISEKNDELVVLNQALALKNTELEAVNNELKQANIKLSEREEHYRALFENTGSGIVVVEKDTTISLVNRIFADSLGLSRRDIENRMKLTEIFCEDDLGFMLHEHFTRRENPGEARSRYEVRFKNRFNELRHCLLYISMIPGTEKSIASILDITERKDAEAALERAEEKYRNLFLNSQVGIFRTELNTGLVLEANDRYARMFGFRDRDELLAEPVLMQDLYIDREVRENMISSVTANGEVRNFEALFRRRDGSPVWICYSARLVAGNKWIDGVAEDITDFKMAEAERNVIYNGLLASEKKYRLIFVNSPLGLFHFNKNGIITDCNPKFEEITGATWKELVGLDMLKVSCPDIRSAALCALNGSPGRCEGVYKSGSSARINLVRVQLESMYDENGNITGGVGIVEDITDKRAAERAMLNELEKERSRIGHTLHDSLGQKLGAVMYIAQALHRKYDKTGELSGGDIEQLLELASSALEETRTLSRGMDLSVIDTGGFIDSLNDIVIMIKTVYGIKIDMKVDDSIMRYDRVKLKNLYYITVESINNAIRHGCAERILLQYHAEQGKGLFKIESFQKAAFKNDSSGMGLRIMKYRAGVSGMEFNIASDDKRVAVMVTLGEDADI